MVEKVLRSPSPTTAEATVTKIEPAKTTATHQRHAETKEVNDLEFTHFRLRASIYSKLAKPSVTLTAETEIAFSSSNSTTSSQDPRGGSEANRRAENIDHHFCRRRHDVSHTTKSMIVTINTLVRTKRETSASMLPLEAPESVSRAKGVTQQKKFHVL